MKVVLAAFVLLTLGGTAVAQSNKDLCCVVAAGATSGPCTSQSGRCSPSGDFSVGLSVLSPDDVPDDWMLEPGATDASFPDGVGGFVFWTSQTPSIGFCAVAGSATATGTVDPVGCLRVSLGAGLGAQMADVELPADPRWDGYELCYGAPNDQTGCAGLNDLEDPAIALTPSGSCCSFPQTFREPAPASKVRLDVDQAIPGVPPPVLIQEPDAGLVPFYVASKNDTFVDVGMLGCLSEYNEPSNCGSPILDGSTNGSDDVDAGTADGDAASSSNAGSSTAAVTSNGGSGCDIGRGSPTWSVLVVAMAAIWLGRLRKATRT
jgi:hypothetical protein